MYIEDPGIPSDPRSVLVQLAGALLAPDAEQIVVPAKDRGELESMVDRLDAGIVILDERGTVVALNEAAQRIFDQRQEDVVGKDVGVILGDPGSELPTATVSTRVDGRPALSISPGVRGRRRGGASFAVELRMGQLLLAGRPLFLVLVHDLLERKRQAEPGRRAEARYRALVEQIPAVTFLAALDEGVNEVYVSPQIEALLGFGQREWLENPILWFQQLHPDDRDVLKREFTRGVATGGPFRAEARVFTKDGRLVWVRGEARLVRDNTGRPLFVQGVVFDITESKRAEQELREAQEMKLRNERLAAIGQIAASISHDLRNPLGAIRNAWFYVQRKLAASALADSDARIASFTVLIERELTRCAAIIGDLLDFSRERPLQRVPCDVSRLVEDVLQRITVPSAGIQLVKEVATDLPVPYLDRDQFEQALVNLVQNAVEAVDAASGRVTLRARADADWMVLEVADDGAGIPGDVREKIFEPLFTTKLRGTGLGLSIVSGTVHRHGGQISVDSAAGLGTMFRVRLPLGRATSDFAPGGEVPTGPASTT